MPAPTRPPCLIQRYREDLQARHCARRTVATYGQWLRRFRRFHHLRHPREMGSEDVNAFLTRLAVELPVSASTQNQALSALLFLDRELLERDQDLKGVLLRARARRRELEGNPALVVGFFHGSGLPLMEALRLRVQDPAAGWGAMMLPHALARKYRHADRQWGWQSVFPSKTSGRTRQRERRAATPWIQGCSKRPRSKPL